VANYAGVMTQNDARNDIIIRGNSPLGVLWRLEGIEIPNPNHFDALGTTGGPVSMLNNNLLTNSDFLTGAFPAEYGNAIAGAFDLNMRSGNKYKREYVGQIGFNGFELGAEGPFSKNNNSPSASYLVNYRYSTLAVFDLLGIDLGTGGAVPQYQDLTFNIDIPGKKFGRIKIIGLGGISYIDLGKEQDSTSNAYNQMGTRIKFGSGLGCVGIAHTYYLNEKSRIKTTISVQRTGSSTKLDSTLVKKPVYRSFLYENKYSVSSQFSQKINSKNNYSIGVVIDRYYTDYIDSVFNTENNMFRTITDVNGNIMLYRGYAQWQHKLSYKITTYGGIYIQNFSLNNETSIEPRLSLRWQFRPGHSVNIGYGIHSQLQPRAVYFTQSYEKITNSYFETNKEVGFTKSSHYILGYNFLSIKNFRINAETYYQDLFNVPIAEGYEEFSMLNAGDYFAIPHVDSLINEGSGKNYGLELTVEKFLSKGYYFLFTASIFDSKYKGYDKVERNTAFNGNYVFNLLGGYEFKVGKKVLLTLDLKTVWAGGKRYIPIDIERSFDEVEFDYTRSYDNKYDDYFRTDFRIGIKINHTKYHEEFGIDLQNIFNYESLFMEEYNPSDRKIYKTYQAGFMPMVLYRLNF